MVTDLSVKQSVCYYTLLKDLGYCHRGLGLQDLWASDIAEDLIKSYQNFRCDKNLEPIMDDNEIAGMLNHFVKALVGRNYLEMEDFFTVCNELGLGDE